MKRFLIFLCIAAGILAAKGEKFPQAIMAGDYPDPTILRDGNDFYMTHSPFNYTPGFLIWHSTDLKNWQPVCRALPEFKGSAMAPDLVKYDGKYYIYYPADGTNWVTWADDIRGPWSQPVDLKVKGIDPGHIADSQGNRYLYVNEGEYVELSKDGLSTTGEKKRVYDGWIYPKKWETEGMCLESPKLSYHNGYFYLTSAEGGTAGPATSHMVVSARSRSISGPWENSPYNPIVHTYSPADEWWSKGHGTIIDDPEGNWWVVYHAYRNGYHTLGRSTLIEPIEWTPDGWFHTVNDADFPKSAGTAANGLQLSDDFSGDKLGLQWMTWHENIGNNLRLSNNSLTIKGKGKSPADSRLLLVTPQDVSYTVETEITSCKNSNAGIMLYYNDKAYTGITSDGKRFFIYSSPEEKTEIPNRIGKHFFARLTNHGNNLSVAVSADGKDWTTLENDIDVSSYHHNNYNGFYALRPALTVSGKGEATFSHFNYIPGIPEDKEGAYLMVFHQDETHGLHMALSRDGYSFTALNNGDPVMSGDSIAEQRGIRDPHIYRGPDGAFYMAMTDLHVFAQRDGLSDKEWERDGKEYGWGNNRALVLMKSHDLINWKRTNMRIDRMSKGLSEIGCAWAPETIYDPYEGKLMIYFTMRYGNESNKLYYVYVNDDYDRLESLPKVLFEYPDKRSSAIDGDITLGPDGQYHLFYVAHVDGGPGIMKATAPTPTGPWNFTRKWYDFESGACEAPNVWKRIGEDKWVLMYDIYSIQPHNFGFIETNDFQTFRHLSHFNDGVMKTTNFTSPKHGAVVHISKEEADRLEKFWENNPRPYISPLKRQE